MPSQPHLPYPELDRSKIKISETIKKSVDSYLALHSYVKKEPVVWKSPPRIRPPSDSLLTITAGVRSHQWHGSTKPPTEDELDPKIRGPVSYRVYVMQILSNKSH